MAIQILNKRQGGKYTTLKGTEQTFLCHCSGNAAAGNFVAK
jgi:hypothetical protein